MNMKNLLIASILLIITIVFAALENDMIFPSAMVGFFLVLLYLPNQKQNNNPMGKAAQYTITTIALLTIALNILASLLVPVIADNTDLTQHFEEETTDTGAVGEELEHHFVEVFLNDAHELCFTVSFILIINGIYLLWLNRNSAKY